MSDRFDAASPHKFKFVRWDWSPLRSNEVSSTTTPPPQVQRTQSQENLVVASSPSFSDWSGSSADWSDWSSDWSPPPTYVPRQDADHLHRRTRNLSDQSDAASPPKSARLKREQSPRTDEVSSTTATPSPELQRTQSKEDLPAAQSPSSADRSLSPGRREGQDPRCLYLPLSPQNLDVTTDSEVCPLLGSFEMQQETMVGDEAATNGGGRTASAAGGTGALSIRPDNESLDAAFTGGVGSGMPELVKKVPTGGATYRSVQSPYLISPDSHPRNFLPTNRIVDPMVWGLPTSGTEVANLRAPLAYQLPGAQQTAGVRSAMTVPIAGTTYFSRSSPYRIHPDSLPFTFHPTNHSANPTSRTKVTDLTPPYSYEFNGHEQTYSAVETGGVVPVMSGAVGSAPLVQTTYCRENSSHQGYSDSLSVTTPTNPSVKPPLVVSPTSSTQVTAPKASVEMFMLSNLSDFNAAAETQKEVLKTAAKTVVSEATHEHTTSSVTMKAKISGTGKEETVLVQSQTIQGPLLPPLPSSGVATVKDYQPNLPPKLQVSQPRAVTDVRKFITVSHGVQPLDLSRGSPSREQPSPPSDFRPGRQLPPPSASAYAIGRHTQRTRTPSLSAPHFVTPIPLSAFPELPHLLPQLVSTFGIPKHLSHPTHLPSGFAVTPRISAVSNDRGPPPSVTVIQPYGANPGAILRAPITPAVTVRCNIQREVPAISPSTVSEIPQPVSPAPDPTVRDHGSDTAQQQE